MKTEPPSKTRASRVNQAPRTCSKPNETQTAQDPALVASWGKAIIAEHRYRPVAAPEAIAEAKMRLDQWNKLTRIIDKHLGKLEKQLGLAAPLDQQQYCEQALKAANTRITAIENSPSLLGPFYHVRRNNHGKKQSYGIGAIADFALKVCIVAAEWKSCRDEQYEQRLAQFPRLDALMGCNDPTFPHLRDAIEPSLDVIAKRFIEMLEVGERGDCTEFMAILAKAVQADVGPHKARNLSTKQSESAAMALFPDISTFLANLEKPKERSANMSQLGKRLLHRINDLRS